MTDIRPFDPAFFHDAAIDADTANLNAQMIELLTGQPEWWVVGAQAARAARRRGEGPFPAPVFSDRARTITITGREGNQIPLRVIAPAQPRGVYLNLHGGGWVLGGADMQDPMLERIAFLSGREIAPLDRRVGLAFLRRSGKLSTTFSPSSYAALRAAHLMQVYPVHPVLARRSP